tara:strand:+ start:1152 stop:2471 length:1320 start_codon:yes stop_codon:yes gene_type:complete
MPGQLANSLQLIAVSNHNQKLTGNPDRTFWRHAHIRSTNFSLDGVKIPLTGNANLGQKTTTVIPREADLLTYLYVCIDLPGLKSAGGATAPSYKDFVGYKLIQKIEMLIGNTCLDSLTGDYMYMWQSLSGKAGKDISEMVGNFDSHDQRVCASQCAVRYYVPIPFWFNSAMAGGHTGAALPIAAIPFQEIKVRLTLNSIKTVINEYDNAHINQTIQNIGTTRSNDSIARAPKDSDCAAYLEAGYVYLDEEEHASVKSSNFEYLITQVQEVKKSITDFGTDMRLDFNHPVRELVFSCKDLQKKQDAEDTDAAAFQPDANGTATILLDPIASVQLRLNSHPRFNQNEGNKVEGRYFRTVQPYQHHSQIPKDSDDDFVYSYSFDLDPENPSPSSSLNFSKVDHAVLEVDFDKNYTQGTFFMYARNWNVVTIQNGMAALGYAS